MSKDPAMSPPPDQAQRDKALDPSRSILVQAPAGSGKTTLLADRFLRVLAEVDEPGQVVAITFGKPAAAEMRNRILDELRKDDPSPLAHAALEHSQALNWNLLDLPAQLRISTIDSFCREIALQQPLLSGFSGSLEISEHPKELYRRAARYTLEQIGKDNAALSQAIEDLLLWRDNNWQDLETQLVTMLAKRDQWMHSFVLDRDPEGDELRARLERPFARVAAPDASPLRYTDQEWRIVRACFMLLRHAAAELRVVFAEAAVVDFIEVSQLALNVLKGEDGLPTDAAINVADGIRHLLVDEFQDTSRRQHQLLAHLIAAWPERDGRTCFVVGDPMQSIYFFRDADSELFPRVEQIGLEIPHELPLYFDLVKLSTNFRTTPLLINQLNDFFKVCLEADDDSGVRFSKAEPAHPPGLQIAGRTEPGMELHLDFVENSPRGKAPHEVAGETKKQLAEAPNDKHVKLVEVIRRHQACVEQTRTENSRKREQEKQKYRVTVLARTHKVLIDVAQALRQAAIPFRAVELENLKERPEILDALALARALLNPQDRVAWLGVLRAPWCGLSLADLHTVAGDGDAGLLCSPVPELLAERAHLLSGEGKKAVERVMHAIDSVDRLRFAETTASLGTWLEQVWLQLGGAQCVDATAHANIDLLWSCLDGLPDGEPDLLGFALNSALDRLTALPDPSADSDCGVQLMTIHKAKGLEFEVVLVPELQAGVKHGSRDLLSWLERGLPPVSNADSANDSAEITEFLVAPLPPKGAEGGAAKKWVDSVRRDRESQEDQRILYVAATRARNELHLFAQPEYETGKDGALTLAALRESLLKTAWPALEGEVRERFAEWRAAKASEEKTRAEEEEVTIDSIAASSEDNLLRMPSPNEPRPVKPARLRRLPPAFRIADGAPAAFVFEVPLQGTNRLYERHEGGLLSRALGKAVHALFQQLAQLAAAQSLDTSLASLTGMAPRITSDIRAIGVDPQQAGRIAAQAFETVQRAAGDHQAQWILAPHAEAENEVRWTGFVDGSLRTVQVDRVFRAGLAPDAVDNDAWWIIDYKTAHEEGLDPADALPELRRVFAPQIEAYAKILRNLRGADATVRGGLYYPRMMLLDWWEV
jgi:ATP-dependent helicase/nuclease subunit A